MNEQHGERRRPSRALEEQIDVEAARLEDLRRCESSTPSLPPPTKHRALRIDLTRVEGVGVPIVGVRKTVAGADSQETFSLANAVLSLWARTAPEDGTYDKCDFLVRYEGGKMYTGRYDLQFLDSMSVDLGEHMRHLCSVRSGRSRPQHMNETEYVALQARYSEEDRAQYANFLDMYEMPDLADIYRMRSPATAQRERLADR